MIAWIFSGQGAQAPGMGMELYRESAAAREVMDMAEKAFPGLISLCENGPADELTSTRNAQPCLLAVELAIAAALLEAGVKPEMTAGFSLGEWAALCASGIISNEEAMRLIVKRAAFMEEAAKQTPGGMAAVLGLDACRVEELCAAVTEGFVESVNYNAPGQTVAAGDAAGLALLKKAVAEAGGKFLPLKVSGPFHSAAMRPAARSLLAELGGVKLAEPAIGWYPNQTGSRYGGEELVPLIAGQCAAPVLWENTVRAMVADGATAFIEVGPGNVLCGLIKRISPGVPALSVNSPKSLAEALEVHK